MTPRIRTVAAGGVLAVGLLTGCSSHTAAPTTPPTAKTITVTGAVLLHMGNQWAAAADYSPCDASLSAGYSDMAQGAQVVIYDNTGKSLAIGQLNEGAVASGACRFTFTVNGVPSGVGPYSVEVAHRGKTAFNENNADDVELTLGS